MTDFESLIKYQNSNNQKEKNEIMMELWEKYSALITKMRGNLNDRLAKCSRKTSVSIEEYKQDIWMTFVHAFETVNISRIPEKKRPKWSFFVHIYNYLRSYNRDYTKHWIKKNINETFLIRTSNDGKEFYINEIKNSCSRNVLDLDAVVENIALRNKISEIEKGFTPLQKDLFKYKYYTDFKVQDICNRCNITRTMYSDEMKIIKENLRNGLQEYRSAS